MALQGLEFYHEGGPRTEDVRELAKYITDMLRRIAHITQEYNFLYLPPVHVEPDRLKEGLIVHADGTDWDPGSGQGLYMYYNSSWNKLG